MRQTFSIEVNGTPKPDISVPTGLYRSAAAAVPALLGICSRGVMGCG